MKAYCLVIFWGSVVTVFGATLCNGDPSPKSACSGWKSLQQLRTLIPERMWNEEFTVRVDRKAFEKANSKVKKSTALSSCMSTAGVKNFYIRSTFAGENIRMQDRYQEFLATPFWDNPPMLERLNDLEQKGN